MAKRKIVVANWKMNPLSYKEAEKLFIEVSKGVLNLKIKKTDLAICPPVIFLERLKKISKKIPFGVQNVFPGDIGAFTGELSVKMLVNLGIKYAILGHSERRAIGETNQEINKKIKSAISNGVIPVLCVGENVRDLEHEYLNFIKNQLLECLEGISKNSLSKIIIAYEPVWAIGALSTRSATPEESLEISIFIKKILTDKFGAKNIEDLRIIYGGSVHPENASSFLVEGKTDGFLAGRDSLNSKKFLDVITITENTK